MFFRVKPAGPYRYLQIAHSVREGKKVRQQVIATLGRLDLLQQSGQLDRLMMRSGVRRCEGLTVLDAHAPARPTRRAGRVEIESISNRGLKGAEALASGRAAAPWRVEGLREDLNAGDIETVHDRLKGLQPWQGWLLLEITGIGTGMGRRFPPPSRSRRSTKW